MKTPHPNHALVYRPDGETVWLQTGPEYIHKQIIKERDLGAAVLLISAELDEIKSLADRIAVMFRGQLVGYVDPRNTTREEIGLMMSGEKRGGAA